MNKKEISIEIKKQIEELLIIAKDSIKTLKKHTNKLKEDDPYIIAPPEEVLKICHYLDKINNINNNFKELDDFEL